MILSDGMTRQEVDRIEANDFALGVGPLRTRDAATLIVLDGAGLNARVLMGRRHRSHAFMPGKFVFPGGQADPEDARLLTATPLHPLEELRIAGNGPRATSARARSIALCALREAYEEAGLLLGRRGTFETKLRSWKGFSDHDVTPALDRLRFIGRAITPPGRIRRFDTRFLAAFRHDVAVELATGGPSNELESLDWLSLDDANRADLPAITRTMLQELQLRLTHDPELAPGGAAPVYRMQRNRFVRQVA